MRNRYKISPLYGGEPYGCRSSLTEAESFALQCAARLNLEARVHDRQTGSLRVYDPGRRRWFTRLERSVRQARAGQSAGAGQRRPVPHPRASDP